MLRPVNALCSSEEDKGLLRSISRTSPINLDRNKSAIVSLIINILECVLSKLAASEFLFMSGYAYATAI